MKQSPAEPLEFTESQCSSHLSATEDALYVIGGKWTLRIIIAVLSGHHRFNALQRNVKGISARVLSAELKDLELNGLVQRTVVAEAKPVIVEYLPTPYSRSLKDIIAALAQWGTAHKRKIMSKAD